MSEGTSDVVASNAAVLRVLVKTLLDIGAIDYSTFAANLNDARSKVPTEGQALKIYDSLVAEILPE